MKHASSTKHKTNLEIIKSATNVTQFMKKKQSSTSEQIAKAELLIAGFFSEHNIPYSHADHFMNVCKRVFSDDKIAEQVAMKYTKMSYLIQDGIAYYEKMSVHDICQKQKFSILIDKSTEILVTQILAIVIRYFDSDKQDVTDALLDTVSVKDGCFLSLCNAIKDFFQEKDILLNNYIGLGFDNCSSIMGKHGGSQKLLRADVPFVLLWDTCAIHLLFVLVKW